MISNEDEYNNAVQLLAEWKRRLFRYRVALKKYGLDNAAVKNVMDPMKSFYELYRDEVASYEIQHNFIVE